MSDFNKGREAVKDQIANIGYFDLLKEFGKFKDNPPNTEFQWGRISALNDKIHHGEILDYDNENNKTRFY